MTNTIPTWVLILAALGIPGTLVAVVGAILKAVEYYRERRDKQADEDAHRSEQIDEATAARQERKDETDAQWNRRARRNIEKHIPWDAAVLPEIRQLRELVNDLRTREGLPAIVFQPLEPPPPLFPSEDPASA